MDKLNIRRAEEGDIPVLDKLLYQVCKVHSDIRPDLFREGAKKYTDAELRDILTDGRRPIFVAELDGVTYHIDPTWGDQSGSIAYRFFGMTEADSLARFA